MKNDIKKQSQKVKSKKLIDAYMQFDELSIKKESYLRIILDMLNKIDDKNLLNDIYMFVQSCYLSK